MSQEWLIRFLEHRIGDKRILCLVQKWLRAGVLEDGRVEVPVRGTGQGASISPLLANIYLHYVLDLWAERWRRREAKGNMVIVRYADDGEPERIAELAAQPLVGERLEAFVVDRQRVDARPALRQAQGA